MSAPADPQTFLAYARRDVQKTMEAMNSYTRSLGAGSFRMGDQAIWDMFNQLVSSQIGLLRAIEEVAGRE